MKLMRWAIVGALMVSALAMTSPSAIAAVRRSGSCSGRSNWALTLKHENGKVEADYEVRTNAAGQKWAVVMKDNGTAFYRGSKVTGADGDFSVDKRTANQPGPDKVVAKATNAKTGEVCKGSATL